MIKKIEKQRDVCPSGSFIMRRHFSCLLWLWIFCHMYQGFNAEVKATRPRPMNSCLSVCVYVLLIKALFMLGWSQGRPCHLTEASPWRQSLMCWETLMPSLILVNPCGNHTVSVCRRNLTLWTSDCRCKRLTTDDQHILLHKNLSSLFQETIIGNIQDAKNVYQQLKVQKVEEDTDGHR